MSFNFSEVLAIPLPFIFMSNGDPSTLFPSFLFLVFLFLIVLCLKGELSRFI